jgi:hypothetical protein
MSQFNETAMLEQPKHSIDRVIALFDEDSPNIKNVRAAWKDVSEAFGGDFRKYMGLFGKGVLAMPEDYPGVSNDVYWENWMGLMQNYERADVLALQGDVNGLDFFMNLSGLHTRIRVMELHHKDVNDAFAGNYEPVI